ncbi:FAD/NAD(P)-binding protein [Geodermatophilus sp. SYSU D01180]
MTQSTLERPGRPQDDGPEAAYDLAFVGAGASTSYVLIALLTSLAEDPPVRPLRIAVVERAPDPFPGVPYGSRAARTSLLITSLRDFLPDAERRLFSDWLAVNKDWAFDDFLAAEGPVSSRWWARHRDAVARDDFDDLFLPRYVFGLHLSQRVRAAIAAASAAGAATTTELQDAVVSLRTDGTGYSIDCRERTLEATHVVLATGSSPVAPRLAVEGDEPAAVLVDDPFDGMTEARDRIAAALRRLDGAGDPPHVVVLGGNASTMDMLYQVNDLAVAAERSVRFTVLTPGGRLPDRISPPRPEVDYRPELLHALRDEDLIRAVDVYEAAIGDLVRGKDAGFSVGETLKPISDGVMAVLKRLSAEETLEFAGHWGVELGRHQRRAGWEYYEVLDELTADGRLETVAGSFTGVTAADGRGVRVHLLRDGVPAELDRPADVVVNCAGPVRRLQDTSPSLVADLISSGVVEPTRYGGGIAVGPTLEAAPGLYVMGPLLAGNVVNGSPVWHMEHCGRISSFGTTLGRSLAAALTAAPASSAQ